MINYYRGFRRIWIILWLLTSLAALVFTCSILQPNPAFPLATIHPEGVQKPLVKPFEEPSDISNNDISKYQRYHNEQRKKVHEEQLQAFAQWESELISAFRVHAYWKNFGLVLLVLGAWSALFWCVWAAGVWIIRGFTSET